MNPWMHANERVCEKYRNFDNSITEHLHVRIIKYLQYREVICNIWSRKFIAKYENVTKVYSTCGSRHDMCKYTLCQLYLEHLFVFLIFLYIIFYMNVTLPLRQF